MISDSHATLVATAAAREEVLVFPADNSGVVAAADGAVAEHVVDACEHATTSLSMHRRNAKTRAARDGPVIQLVRHHTPTILARSKA